MSIAKPFLLTMNLMFFLATSCGGDPEIYKDLDVSQEEVSEEQDEDDQVSRAGQIPGDADHREPCEREPEGCPEEDEVSTSSGPVWPFPTSNRDDVLNDGFEFGPAQSSQNLSLED